MNKYLIEILKIRTSVILPGFGALMIANTKTGKIVLNRHLKFDDGVLAKFISEKEAIDMTEAKNMVSKFVREIESVVGKGDTYDIFQFGKISKNEKGELTFHMDDSLKKEPISPIVSTPKKEIKPAIKKEEKPANTLVSSVKTTETKKEEVKPVVKKEESKKTKETENKETKNTYVPTTKTAVKKELVDKNETSPKVVKEEASIVKKDTKALEAKKKLEAKELAAKSKKEAKELESKKKKEAKVLAIKKKEEAKIATAKAKKEKLSKKKGAVVGSGDKPVKKKKKKLIPLLLLVILIGGLGFAGYKYQNQIKEMIGYTSVSEHHDGETGEEHSEHSDNELADTETTEIIEEVVEDTLMSEEIVESEEDVIEEEDVEEVKPVVSNSINGSYHIIGGGFEIESNATGYADKNGGTVLGKFDNLYLVALKSYDSRADAQSDLSNVRNTSSSAWIFKYSK